VPVYHEVLPPSKSQKHRAYTWEPVAADTPLAGVLTLADSKSHTRYAVEEFPADRGRGFCLRKGAGAGHYCCNLVAGAPAADACECRGFEAHGRCKHLDSLRDLVAAGHL
jgi:hypothetical protein